MSISLPQVLVFALILARVSGLFSQAAFFNYKSIPVAIKAAICFFLTLVLWNTIPVPAQLPSNEILMVVAILQEFFIGKLMGFVSFIIVQAVLAAGDLMGMQMGLSVANQLDPRSGTQVNIVGQFFDQTAILFFLMINGHLMILTALQKSFAVIPLVSSVNFSAATYHVIGLGYNLWELAVRLSAPVLLSIFLLDFALGTISRVAPQVNVFQLGFQVKPTLGLVTLYLMVPLLIWRVVEIMNTILAQTSKLFGYMKL
jgi:flagellar biosynthetic protein FliR